METNLGRGGSQGCSQPGNACCKQCLEFERAVILHVGRVITTPANVNQWHCNVQQVKHQFERALLPTTGGAARGTPWEDRASPAGLQVPGGHLYILAIELGVCQCTVME